MILKTETLKPGADHVDVARVDSMIAFWNMRSGLITVVFDEPTERDIQASDGYFVIGHLAKRETFDDAKLHALAHIAPKHEA